MAEFEAGNLYDINKSVLRQTGKKLIGQALANKMSEVVIPFLNDHSDDYFMLLCHERRDYTIFNLCSDYGDMKGRTASELKECLLNRGDIFAIDKADDGALEIWVDIPTEELFCFYFFPCDPMVIEV